jgi:uncharacterized membrane protein YhdT
MDESSFPSNPLLCLVYISNWLVSIYLNIKGWRSTEFYDIFLNRSILLLHLLMILLPTELLHLDSLNI